MEDWFAGMDSSAIARKYGIVSPRSLRRWLQEWGRGEYDQCMTWDKKTLMRTFRMKGAGHPLEDPELEKTLLRFMETLKNDKLQFVTPLLVMEALFHRPLWKGGVGSPGFKGRVQAYIQSFLARNSLSWRAPTSIGQKLPDGWMGKWFYCSLFYYIKTEGVANKQAMNGDETKFLKCFVAKRQIAEKGAKEVPAGTDGGEKDGISTFLYTDADANPQILYTDADANPQRPFFIVSGEVAPNRPQLLSNMKRNRGTIREKIERAVREGRLDPWFDVWVNKAGYMDSEAMLHLIKCIGTRKPRNSDGSYVLSSLLVDSCPSHKNEAVRMLCDDYNILLFIIAGRLTPKANLADVEYIKSTKQAYYEEIVRLRARKYAQLKARVTDNNGVVTAAVKPPKMGLIECMNVIIQTWKKNDFSRAKARFTDIRMLTHAQGREKGWTPQGAFHDYVPTEEEASAMESILPPSVNANKKRNWEAHTFHCLHQKCSRKSYFGFSDEQVPRFCQMHKLEGMIELVAWKPSFRKSDAGVPRHVPTKSGFPPAVLPSQEQKPKFKVPPPPPPPTTANSKRQKPNHPLKP